MNLEEIVQSCLNDSKKWFGHISQDLAHHALALGGEVGELQNIIKKIDRGSTTLEAEKLRIADEVVDVFIYLCNFAGLLGIDLNAEYERKRALNEDRFGLPTNMRAPTSN